jgi:hypothetical protein
MFRNYILTTLISCPSREWLRYNYETYCRGGSYDGTQWTDGFLNFVSNNIDEEYRQSEKSLNFSKEIQSQHSSLRSMFFQVPCPGQT